VSSAACAFDQGRVRFPSTTVQLVDFMEMRGLGETGEQPDSRRVRGAKAADNGSASA
jgi:hypothetical protein